MARTVIRRIYVWQWPVRMYHWINFLCVAALVITGYLIGRPLAIQMAREASFSYWFGTVRFIHFLAAFIFFFNFLFRIYWGFVGNQFARWDNFIPLGRNVLQRHWRWKRLRPSGMKLCQRANWFPTNPQ